MRKLHQYAISALFLYADIDALSRVIAVNRCLKVDFVASVYALLCWAPQTYILFRKRKFRRIAMGGPQVCGNFLHFRNRK